MALLITGGSIPEDVLEKERTSLAELGLADLKTVKLDEISSLNGNSSSDAVLLIEDVQALTSNFKALGEIADKVLARGGKLRVKATPAASTPELQAQIVRKVKYSGFINVKVDGDYISGETEKEVGKSDPIKLELNGLSDDLLQRKLVAPVSISGDDLIDEDSLLTEEDKQKPDPASSKFVEQPGRGRLAKTARVDWLKNLHPKLGQQDLQKGSRHVEVAILEMHSDALHARTLEHQPSSPVKKLLSRMTLCRRIYEVLNT